MTYLSNLKKVLTENITLKIAALALSFLMWVSLSNDQPVERVLSVRLDYQHVPDGMEISSQTIATVDVHIRMPGRRRTISESDVAAYVDLKDATAGEKIIHLDPQKNARGPAGVEILKLSPPRITLFLEPTVQAMVPVEPAIDGTPAEGFAVVRVAVQPTKVYISGPESHVRRVGNARTETVVIDHHRATETAWVNINVADPKIRIIDTKPVQVIVEIAEKRKEVLIENLPVHVASDLGPINVRPKTIKVCVSVPLAFDTNALSDMIHVVANISELDLAEGKRTVEPEIKIQGTMSDSVKIVSIMPPVLEVRSAGRKR
ncbi:MAG: YbbR-like domain-containing protein [Acidobacteria bacterium]|nr:YbbR-like domain-containing protein [Acidobacteriota bacterium]MBI3656520.1 YbbR-like domain-containing protein [Acidobacteriota bacterium]